jgi:hypothetical protein
MDIFTNLLQLIFECYEPKKNKIMKTKLILVSTLCTFILLCSINTNAQRKSSAKKTGQKPNKSSSSISKSSNNKNGRRFFTNIFWNGFINGGISPGYCEYLDQSVIDPNTGLSKSVKYMIIYKSDLFGNLLFLGVNERFILKQLNDDHSICVEASPSFGLGGSSGGALNLEVPVCVSYNLGNAATYDTKKEKGFGVGLGLQYMRNRLVPISDGNNYSYVNGYVEPIFVATYRYLSSNFYPREWSLKIGSGAVKQSDKLGLSGTAIGGDAANGFNPTIFAGSTYSVRLSMGFYIGY